MPATRSRKWCQRNDRYSDTGARDCDEFKEVMVICHSLPQDGLPSPDHSSVTGSAATMVIEIQRAVASPIRLSAQRTPALINKVHRAGTRGAERMKTTAALKGVAQICFLGRILPVSLGGSDKGPNYTNSPRKLSMLKT